jgi:hypothetical protein
MSIVLPNPVAAQLHSVSLTANGTSETTTCLLEQYNLFHQFGTSTSTNYACILPPNGQKFPAVYTVRNDGAYHLAIFPNSGAAIDGRTATTVPLYLGCQASVQLVQVSSTQWYSFNYSGNAPVRTIAAATTLTKYDSGQIIAITQSSAFTITLPDPTASLGCKFIFTVGVTGANIVTIDSSAAAKLAGGNSETIAGATASLASLAGGNERNLVIAATSPIGTKARFESDGIRWKVDSICPVTAKVTFS